ncbi:hybrid sensor histidine kinase/response regulator [Geminicoccus harenae]|uniref:hybrid sensor histidine kinase/response regulator n=1 Tax=Geminicoccus harenae TaxID=2498453 RepID=UPI001CC2FD9B|nr:PAS domain-containing sensor histidine kinase [Geminicoccus harenae]
MAAGERSFRLLIDAVSDHAIYLLDPQGRIITWNPGAERTTGYLADEVTGQDFSRFFTLEDQAAGRPGQVLAAAAADGRCEDEGWQVRKDGSRFWATTVLDAIRGEDGELIGFAGITRDFTERKLAEDALRASERQFRRLVQGVTDYAIFMLDPDGYVTSWNSGAAVLKGYRADEIIGQHFSRFYTEEDRAIDQPARALAAARERGHFEKEGWRVRKDGSRFFASVVIDPIHENGQLVGFAKVTRDITERRQAQEALEEAREQLFQAQKMEAIGQLTGGVAHDFNNLLQAISGCLQMVERRVDDPRVREILVAGQQAIDRGARLTQQLLAFARRQPLHPERIDIGTTLRATSELLARSLRADIRLKMELEPDLWPIEADPTQFELALLNLAVNARDAMPDGGQLTIEGQNLSLAPGRDPDGLAGDFVRLRVIDTGTGMPAEVAARACEPFFTTKEVGKGSGLGLSQVYGFARQSGGAVRIETRPGAGTTIVLVLPRAQAAGHGASLPAPDQGTAVA